MNAAIYDTETTGTDPEVDHIIQDAFLGVTFGSTGLQPTDQPTVELWGSPIPISYGAMEVHRITERMIQDLPVWKEVASMAFEGISYLIGHNIDFDWKMAGQPPLKRICTLAIARHCYPDASSHKLGAIHLMQQNGSDAAIKDLDEAHDAGADVVLTLRILHHMLKSHAPHIDSMEALWKWSEQCRLPVRWGFGKFKGEPLQAADKGYISWYLRQPEPDPYYVVALRNL